MAVLRILQRVVADREDFDVQCLTSACHIERHQTQRCAALAVYGCCKPRAIADDHWRRPAESGYRCLPNDVLRFTPLRGQALLGGMAFSAGSSKLRPVLGGEGRREEEDERCRDSVHRAILLGRTNTAYTTAIAT